MRTLLKLRLLLLYALTLLISVNAWSQVSCYNTIGYLPSWVGAPSAIDYTKWTHINYAFGIPNTNGTIGAIENSSKLQDLVTRAHANNTKVLLSIGGWLSTSPSNTPFENISTNSTVITQFVNSCANLVTQYNLDGIDIDWEYPTSTTRWNAIMQPLGTRIHSMGKMCTAAVPDGSYSGNNYGDLSMLDLVNIMSYDCSCPTTAPYSEAVSSLNYWTGRGVPQNKRMLGVPFYSSDNYTALHVQKANLVKSGAAGGIMVWDVATNYGDINSIVSTLGTLCKGITPTCPVVNLSATIQAEAYCTMSGIQLEATTDTGGGQNVGYIDAADWIAYKVNVPSTGTYTVQYRVASLSGGGSIRLEPLGGGTPYGTIAVPSTGGWQTWTTISQTISLTAGQKDIALAFPAGGFNINWISITGGGGSSNLAQGKPATASSSENATYAPAGAVDGNASTRWSSLFTDAQWIYVDLGATYNVNRVKITWEAAYGRNYTIQTSPNASTWTTIKTVTGNTTLVNDNTGLSGSGRYIRINGTLRGTAYGYSIFELEVYGTAGGRLASEEIVAVEVDQDMIIAYPNPTERQTTIAVNLPKAGHAVVSVAGSLGNKISDLHNGYLEAGNHEFTFNAENLATGLYTYSVTFNGKRITKKLIKK